MWITVTNTNVTCVWQHLASAAVPEATLHPTSQYFTFRRLSLSCSNEISGDFIILSHVTKDVLSARFKCEGSEVWVLSFSTHAVLKQLLQSSSSHVHWFRKNTYSGSNNYNRSCIVYSCAVMSNSRKTFLSVEATSIRAVKHLISFCALSKT